MSRLVTRSVTLFYVINISTTNKEMASSEFLYAFSDTPVSGETYNWYKSHTWEPRISNLSFKPSIKFLLKCEVPYNKQDKPRFVSCSPIDVNIIKMTQDYHGEFGPTYISGRKGTTDHSSEMYIAPGSGTIMGIPGILPNGMAESLQTYNLPNHMITIEQFLGTILYSSIEAHILHLKTVKYSNHMALDEFYKAVPEAADEIIERTQANLTMPIQSYENLLHHENFKGAKEYLEGVKSFVNTWREKVYNPEKHSEILSSIDDYLGLLDSAIYKLSTLTEGLDGDIQQSEVERQYITGNLTYNGINVKKFFDDKSEEISRAIEARLGRTYRYISRNYKAIFYSKVTKQFITVFQSYAKNTYGLAAMPMISLYTPEVVTGAKLVHADTTEDIIKMVKEYGNSYVPIFIQK